MISVRGKQEVDLHAAEENTYRARQAGGQQGRSEAEEVLLTHALAVRLILARMEEAVEHGVAEGFPGGLDDVV
jgi:hypothetical protein